MTTTPGGTVAQSPTDISRMIFTNRPFVNEEGGVLTVPADDQRSDGSGLQGHHYAFHRDLCCRDATVRFEFRLDGHSDAGVILRARDRSDFYLVHFPCCGQARRAQHFWVAFSRMDHTGYLRCIKLEMVRRVSSYPASWLKAEVRLEGNKVRVSIGDNGSFEAEDGACVDPGHIGFFLTGPARLRNISVEGAQAPRSRWDDTESQPTNWFHPIPDSGRPWQKPQDLVRLPDGELVLTYIDQRSRDQGEAAVGTLLLVRSSNNGASWSAPTKMEFGNTGNAWFAPRIHITPGGRLIALVKDAEGYCFSESVDGARNWSPPQPAGIAAGLPHVPALYAGPQAFLNLSNGAMVLFAYGGHDLKDADLGIYTWGSTHCQAFACRSVDDGRTWSSWRNVDNVGKDADGKQIEGNLDLTEVCAAQMGDGGPIVAFIRPVYSPWMWETWSRDGGETWGPCVTGAFPGYATPNMLRTRSGATIVAHRLPTSTINCSWDDGRTWDQGTMIDNAIWSMGTMVEVEPDLVLYVYFDAFESLMRAQYIRVTRDGLTPALPHEVVK